MADRSQGDIQIFGKIPTTKALYELATCDELFDADEAFGDIHGGETQPKDYAPDDVAAAVFAAAERGDTLTFRHSEIAGGELENARATCEAHFIAYLQSAYGCHYYDGDLYIYDGTHNDPFSLLMDQQGVGYVSVMGLIQALEESKRQQDPSVLSEMIESLRIPDPTPIVIPFSRSDYDKYVAQQES